VFNVSLNGTRVLSNFDLVAQGAFFTPLDRSFPVTVTDGTIRINAQGVTRAALLNAIQIVPSPALQVSPGSLSFTGFAGGSHSIAPEIICMERWSAM
jgi:hypothetical protein